MADRFFKTMLLKMNRNLALKLIKKEFSNGSFSATTVN